MSRTRSFVRSLTWALFYYSCFGLADWPSRRLQPPFWPSVNGTRESRLLDPQSLGSQATANAERESFSAPCCAIFLAYFAVPVAVAVAVPVPAPPSIFRGQLSRPGQSIIGARATATANANARAYAMLLAPGSPLRPNDE